MQLVTSQFDKNDSSVRTLAARNEVLNKEIDQQRGKIETLRAALQKASDSFGENDRRTQSWQIQLNRAQAELNGMEREVEQNSRTLDDLSRSAENDATHLGGAADSADGLSREVRDLGGEMEGTGKKTSLFGDMLKANLLSEAIIGGVRALGSAIVGIGKSFSGAMKDGVEYNAQMESYTASFTTMLGDQAKAQKLVTDLKKEAAATPFGMQDLASAMQTLMGFGMSAADAQKHMKELGDISQGDSERFKSLTLAFAQASSAGKLTGQDLLQIINAGFNPLEEISRKTGKSIGELKQEMEQGGISAAMLADAFASATSEGGRFYGSMEAQSKTFYGQMSTLDDNVSSLKGQLSERLTTMLSDTVLPMVNGWLGELSTAFSQDGAKGLIDVFGGILQEAVQFIVQQLPVVVSIASQIIISLVQGLTAALPQITEAAITLLVTLVNGILANLPQIVSAALQVIVTLASGIGDALPSLIPAMIDAVLTIVNTLLNNMDKVLAAAYKIIEGLAKGLINALPKLIDRLPQIIDSIVNFIVSNLPIIIETGVNIIAELTIGLIKAIPTLVAKLPQIISALVNGFGKLLGAFNNIGSNIVSGIWQGIAGMKDWIYAKVKDFFGGIVDSVKGMLGIYSPSTVFAGIGGYMAQGLGQGFSKAMDDISADMQAAIPTSFNLSPAVNMNTALSGSSSNSPASGGFTLHIENFVNNTEKDIERLAYEFEFYRQQAAAARGNT
nr:MAG TPA: tail tape measure protein [Caudoviricetes sp.]